MAKLRFWEYPDFRKNNPEWYEALKANDFNAHKALQHLRSHYAGKLKKSGFIDADPDDNPVIQPEIITMQNASDYYELCEQILREFPFKKQVHRLIFELHTIGNSERQIVEILAEKHGFKMSRRGVNDLLNRVKTSFRKGG
jgi:hypothetical protein